ncbi:glutamate racemase [Lentilactobacillus sp. SPB1-3]|uniref:Glutamate racemase n=1 Tax=Lentilactobacillus terminaliae TaxID=3003483 RepID=A0ACD5DCB2_9LACO|nr:glutamate racemase [Lentilactobacillus sp. SPB1-3]MCZ0977356.1 glutamate racemase [Lentilactobacillus sp. SPB1-3]
MDNRKIGVMDSGIGGLTVYDQLQKVLPNEQFIYVGDQANLPYGEKSAEQVYELTRRIADYFVDQDVKAMVIACNTATAAAYERLKDELPIPVIGVIQPGADTALSTSKNHSIGVIATNGTVKSGDYERIIKNAGDFEVISQGCPDFVSLVENGEAGSAHSFDLVSQQLGSFKDSDIDTMILGCTHFPVISAEVAAALPGVTLVDPGVATATQVADLLTKKDALTSLKQNVADTFYTTGNVDDFVKVADNFLESKITADHIEL